MTRLSLDPAKTLRFLAGVNGRHGGADESSVGELSDLGEALRLLDQNATQYGYHLYRQRLPIDQATRDAHENAPVVLIGPYGCIGVCDRKGKRVRVQALVGGSEPNWIPLKTLAARLGVPPAGELDRLTAEPAGPLEDLRSDHAGNHDDDGHHGHVPPITRLRALLRADSSDLWIIVIYSVVAGLLTLALPIAVQSLVNTVSFGRVMQPLVVLTIFVLGALLFYGIVSLYRLWIVEVIQRRIFVRVATDATYRLVRVRPDVFERSHAPELVNRFFDVVTVQKSSAVLLVDGMSVLMQTVLGMILLAVYHPWLLVFDILLVAAILFILFGLGRQAVPTAIEESKMKYAIAAWLEEIAGHPVTFKSPEGALLARDRAEALVRGYLRERHQHFRILMRQIGGTLVLQAAASAALLGIGGWLVIDRQLALGQLVAAELVVTAVVSGFAKFGKHLEAYYDMMAALDKLGYLIDLPLEESEGEPVPRRPGPASIEFQEVEAGTPLQPSALVKATWKLEPGQHTAVLVRDTSHSNLVGDLLYRIRRPRKGLVLVDGRDLRDWSLEDLRAQVALARGVEIFDGTVTENIRLGNSEVSLETVEASLEAAGLMDAVRALPQGVRTHLSTDGRPLSLTQCAALVLARALATKPRLLVVDGVLDLVAEPGAAEQLIDALLLHRSEWTLLLLTGRPELAERFQNRFELNRGELRQGS